MGLAPEEQFPDSSSYFSATSPSRDSPRDPQDACGSLKATDASDECPGGPDGLQTRAYMMTSLEGFWLSGNGGWDTHRLASTLSHLWQD